MKINPILYSVSYDYKMTFIRLSVVMPCMFWGNNVVVDIILRS